MYTLIRKDLLLQKYTLLILIPILLMILFLEPASIWFGVVFSIATIMNVFVMDEKPTIHVLLNSLPYTRKEIVSSKYAGTFIFTAIFIFIIFIGHLIFHQEILPWKEPLLILSLVMVFTSFYFPFSYRFKTQYLTFAGIGLLALYLITVTLFIPNLHDRVRDFMHTLLMLEDAQVFLLIIGSASFLYVCSWLLSIYIYSKKGE
ncbi:ABC-2 transporter permease [Alkalihalobacillus sp. LMS39]|uniref:ABC-2 transporter permease n=1 Tax=Alkalihalobacillus sp. LMS39 TaxID=2924032 RepID=UPI001FB46AA3|nr:ABC-2 transporter permease [Alkalihalobacillus sp. LMS39]UOE95839.1 ABC-2 transporter permease [Alkalihalobacillus sp. LMS39]